LFERPFELGEAVGKVMIDVNTATYARLS